MSVFRKATKKAARGRVALVGPSGSGKSYTALKMARQLGTRIAAIDTERGSLSKYADLFEFDALELDSFAPKNYVQAIKAAEAEGYEVLIIDSLSHAWSGKDGALEMADKAATRSRSGSSFAAWREVTPEHNELVEAILQSKMHVIATMRTKTEWVLEKDEKGKSAPKKVGLAPIQKAGVEYEFDLVVDLDHENNFVVSKTRCSALAKHVANCAGDEEGKIFAAWLSDGVRVPEVTTEVIDLVTTPSPTDPAPPGEDWEAKFEADLRAAKGNPEQLAAAKAAVMEASKLKLINADVFRRLGSVYNEVRV